MPTISKLSLLLIVLLVVAACAPATAPTDVAPEVIPTTAPEVVAPATFDLAGTNWVLTSLNGSPAVADTTVTLQFGADGTVSGTDGCNRFSTTFTQDGANLTINQAASTMMMCVEPEGVMEQAAAYMIALAATTNFSANESQLALLAGNQIVATFAADVQELAGSEWDVVQFNNGQEAVVSVIIDTEITAIFGDSGELSGSAGCNQYMTSYTIDGNTIAIDMPATTRRLCPEPKGVMEQEQAFLAALQSAATFSIEGDMLQMRTADDAGAVIMTRRVVVDLPAPPEPTTPTGTVVGTQSLNVRSGPGTAFPVIGVASAGDQGEIVGVSADGRWWAVAVPSAPDGIGWVSVDFVLATNAENVPVMQGPPPPVATATPVPPAATATPVPAQPTATPSAEIVFTADRTTIMEGECATLSWSVQNVQAVWVYPLGANYASFPQTGQSSQQVCPTTTTTYEMRVRLRDGTTQFRQVTITVTPLAPTATPVPTTPPAPVPDPLTGTRWNVVSVNNGSGIVSLAPGTSITMDFGTDGQVTGSSGCNTYFASFSLNGNAISIGQPGATSLFCADPAGVMDQEQAFLAALQAAATFRITGSQLDLTTAGGQIAITANQAP